MRDTSEAKRAELRAYRLRRVLRWYRIRLWGTAPLVAVTAGVLLATVDHAAVEAVSRIALGIGLAGTAMAARSAWIYLWLVR